MFSESVNHDPAGEERRPYQSERRALAAAETRARIRRSAELLFLERGYVGTTTKAIAAAAEVSEKTVFLTFPGKAALLAEIIRYNVRGDAPDERAVDAAPWQAMLALPTDELLPRFAKLITEILERTARITVVAEAAAHSDAELAARGDLGRASERETIGSVITELAGRSEAAAPESVERAVDVVTALASASFYLRLVDGCGWQPEDYASWLTGATQDAVRGLRGAPAT